MGIINTIKNLMMRTSMSMSNVEKDMLGSQNIEGSNHNISISNEQSGLYADLIGGVESQAVKEFRARHYAVISEMSMNKITKKSNGELIYSKRDFKEELSKVHVDGRDLEYELLFHVFNRGTLSTGIDSDVNVKGNKKIDISSNNISRYNLTQFITTLSARKIDDDLRLIELVFEPKEYQGPMGDAKIEGAPTYEISHNAPTITHHGSILNRLYADLTPFVGNPNGLGNIIDIKEIAFKTDDSDLGTGTLRGFLYEFIKFHRVTIGKGNLVVKFIAKKSVEDINIVAKYQMDSVDEAYRNKAERPK